MILEIQIQSLVFLLSLRESLLPTRIRQRCRRFCVAFILMVVSPIGSSRFSHETFRFLLQSIRDFCFSKSTRRFRTRIWDPGKNGSEYREYWIRNRFWPVFTPSIFDEEETRRWTIEFPDWAVVYLGLHRKILTDQPESLSEAPTILIPTHGQDTRLWRRRLLIMEKMMRLSYSYWIWYFLLIYFVRHFFCYESLAGFCKWFCYRRHDSVPLQATFQSICLIRVMRQAFGSFIYMMIAYYKYMKRGLNRFHLLPVRLLLESRVTSTSSSKLGFNFLYLFQWLFSNGFMYHVSCKTFMK